MPAANREDTLAVSPPRAFAEPSSVAAGPLASFKAPTNHPSLTQPSEPPGVVESERNAHPRCEGAQRVRVQARGLVPSSVGFHVTFRLADDRPIATNIAQLRLVARVLLAQGEQRGLLAFGAADNHLHAQLATDRATAGAFAHGVETSLRWQLALGVSFEPARVRPLIDQAHAYSTFHYVQRQDSRHAIGRDLAREATSLPDLLGLRMWPTSIADRVRTHLPRTRRADLVGHFPPGTLQLTVLEPAPLETLREAACAAFALPGLDGLSADVIRARRAAVQAAAPTATSRDLAHRLQLSVRAIQKLREQRVDDAAVRAVLLQAHLGRNLSTTAQ